MTITIKHKLLFGYSAILILLLIVALVAFNSFSQIEVKITKVAQDSQPKVIASLELASQVYQGSSALAYYMLSSNEVDKKAYLEKLHVVRTSLAALQSLAKKSQDTNVIKEVKGITHLVTQLNNYKDTMFELAVDTQKNIPALKIASQQLEPIGEKLLQLTTDIVLAEADTEDIDELSELTLAAQELRFNWAMVTSNVRSYLAFRDEALIGRMNLFKAGTQQIVQDLNALEDRLGDDQIDALEEFIELQQQYFSTFDRAYTLHSSEKWRTDAFLVRSEIGPLLKQIESALDKLVAKQQGLTLTTTQELQSLMGSAMALLTALVFIATLLAVVVGYLSVKNIIVPLRKAVFAMQEVSAVDGDLTKRLKEDNNDEIGQLGTAFNDFIIKILTLIRSIAFVGKDLTGSTVRLTQVADHTKEQVVKLQKDCQQVSNSMTEMSTMVKDVTANSVSAANASEEAQQEASSGSEVVMQTIEVINQLHSQFAASSQQIKHLSTECESIKNVVAIIREIADTTNLLSLNAAIEAARAGESGRGFAVVADEVRGLASRTQSSVDEIQASIDKLMSDSRSAVQNMEQGGVQVKLCVDKAAMAGQSLSKITQVVNTINDMNKQIAAAAEQQHTLFNEVRHFTEQISKSTEDVSKEGASTATEGQRLKMLSDEMVQLVGRFKLGDMMPDTPSKKTNGS